MSEIKDWFDAENNLDQVKKILRLSTVPVRSVRKVPPGCIYFILASVAYSKWLASNMRTFHKFAWKVLEKSEMRLTDTNITNNNAWEWNNWNIRIRNWHGKLKNQAMKIYSGRSKLFWHSAEEKLTVKRKLNLASKWESTLIKCCKWKFCLKPRCWSEQDE